MHIIQNKTEVQNKFNLSSDKYYLLIIIKINLSSSLVFNNDCYQMIKKIYLNLFFKCRIINTFFNC